MSPEINDPYTQTWIKRNHKLAAMQIAHPRVCKFSM